jgi:hypothetical protein
MEKGREKKDTNKKKRVGGGKEVDGHGDSDVLRLKCSDSANTPPPFTTPHRQTITPHSPPQCHRGLGKDATMISRKGWTVNRVDCDRTIELFLLQSLRT